MKGLFLAGALAALPLVGGCKDSTSVTATVSCSAGDPICPATTATGFTGVSGSPLITPSNAATTISVSNSSFSISGTTSATTQGYWFIVVGNQLRATGQLAVVGGAYGGDIPLFCGTQLVLVSFNNASGRSYYGSNVTLTACTTASFRVQLTWDTGPLSSDIDLHLVRPSGTVNSANDCYYSNCAGTPLEWGATGAAGDPLLDVDNTDGFGPENIVIGSGAETGLYTVVVRNYNGVAATRATVKIFFNDVEQQRFTSNVLTPGTADYWQVATVNILTKQITAVNTYTPAAPFAMGDIRK